MFGRHRCPMCGDTANIVRFDKWIDRKRVAHCHCSRCGRDWDTVEKKAGRPPKAAKAQQVERIHGKDEAVSSILTSSSNILWKR